MPQVIELVGVIDNGQDFSPEVPKETSRTIEFPRAGDVTLGLSVFYPSGEPVDLSGGMNAIFTMRAKQDPLYSPPDLQKVVTTVVSKTVNKCEFSISANDTKLLIPARYWFDVWLVLGGLHYQVVRPGVVILTPSMVVF